MKEGQGRTVSEVYEETARLLNVEDAAIRAVCEIESGGRSGFLKDGRPIILFEGHIFWQELKKRGINPEKYQADYSDVLFPKWDKSSYKGGVAEYDRLNKAATIEEEAALCSASWGMFQIMGFNHKLCGYNTVREYVDAIKSDSNNHLRSFARFLKNTGIDKPLRNLDWAVFAAKYNGAGYKQNRYDEKLQNAYLKYKLH
ncbi:N-acetylmuramidase family protein [Viscerimonas tarda]